MYNSIKEKLIEKEQEQLLNFYDELSDVEKSSLINQIDSIDFDLMNKIYKDSYLKDEFDSNLFSPLPIIKSGKRKVNIETAESIIKNNEYAVLIMAGGSASRLGYHMPKGCININIKGKETPIFEIYINQFKKIHNEFGIYPTLYLMLNDEYKNIVIDFFENNNYFDYPKENIKFFVQNNLPILNTDGKILLKNKNTVLTGPNGNGDVFKSLKKSGLINDIKEKNIKYVLFTTIDNVKTNLFDLDFIGAIDNWNFNVGTKTIMKKDGMAKDWVFCKYNNHPSMMQSSCITEEFANKQIDGNYVYRESNITYHIIKTSSIEKYANLDLEYHRSYKKNSYIDMDGNIINPETPNSFKFERFIFDAFNSEDDMLLYRTDESEFFPVKNEEDLKNAEIELNK